MKVSTEAIQALYDEVNETGVDAPYSAHALYVLGACKVALDGYAEQEPAIEYARVHGLKVVRMWPDGELQDITVADADWVMANHPGSLIEVHPGWEAVEWARDECAELIRVGWRTKAGAQ